MGYARALGAGVVGVAGCPVEIEADIANGLPTMRMSGLPDAALHEAGDRIRAAITNSRLPWPDRRLTVNLLPAAQPKHGSGFDLPVACAVLAAGGAVPAAALATRALIGELGLDGRVRPVRGVLPMAVALAATGVTEVVVPSGNAGEATLVPGLAIHPADDLAAVVGHLRGTRPLARTAVPAPAPAPHRLDLAEVAGQELGRRALEVAAAGGHHLALLGPPGAGKTMLAERLPTVLPPLDDAAALEVTALHSLAGVLGEGALVRHPPFQAPHHTSTLPALVGGGSGMARPGALSLAHRGVLFLDEAPEFSGRALEALRQPLETGRIRVRRAGGGTDYPARVQLVVAANPCPCAQVAADGLCPCTSIAKRRYTGRLSGALRDRIDIQLALLPVRAADLTASAGSEGSAAVAARVAAARAVAARRWAPLGCATNAEVSGAVLRHPPYALRPADTRQLRDRLDRGVLTARGYDRALRLAWTVADLDGRDRPAADDIAEALALRTGALT
ncbi:hypothetical protein GCM10010124_20760 [Pilimelia terevasa]|uniref:MCM C-terminal AAA(+) ATPase domain-containing protein n=1 Tax=Pilimelia terevasa TaxID=53372 RepID=A0A8J3BK25_9ACTN|nr:YifB family Mg chelatase-like AAA ATPase [Pilimelia terevasa]GGK28012.1 hypothetical protein GCM10010124_20760 [Pilimelia terevasa]